MLPTVFKTRKRYAPTSILDEWLNDSYLPSFVGPDFNRNRNLPSVNVEETDKGYKIDVAAPGLSKKDFNINLDQNVLTISAKQESKNEKKEENFVCREFNYNSFERSFSLPEDVDASKITAGYNNGILTIEVPHSEARSKVQKTIKIK
jgi:HSP20 family protein